MEQQAKSAVEEFDEAEDVHQTRLAQIKLDASRSGSTGYKLEIGAIMVGAEQCASLTFRAQKLSDGRASRIASAEDPNIASEEYLLSALTGLDLGVLGQLDWQDFEAAAAVLDGITRRRAGGLLPDSKKPEPPEKLFRAVMKAHDEWLASVKLAAARSGASGYMLELYHPITVKGEKRAGIIFRPQTLRDMREAKAKQRQRRGLIGDDMLAADLSGLSVEDLGQLDWEDWEAVQAVIEGFARRRAAGGPALKV